MELPAKAKRLIASALRDRVTVLQLELIDEDIAEEVRCEREDDLSYAQLILALFEYER